MTGRSRRINGGQTGGSHRDPASGRFEPGNPGGPGRPKGGAGLKALIRESTRDGAELVEIMLSVARGQAMKVQGRRRGRTPRIGERMEAIKYLTDRGWGRVAQEGGEGDLFPYNVTLRLGKHDYLDLVRDGHHPPVLVCDDDGNVLTREDLDGARHKTGG